MSGGRLVLGLLLLTLAWRAVLTQDLDQWTTSGKIRLVGTKPVNGPMSEITSFRQYVVFAHWMLCCPLHKSGLDVYNGFRAPATFPMQL